MDLGVGELPEEEVRDPLLAARADEEIGIRQAPECKFAGDARLVDGGQVERDRFLTEDVLARPGQRLG